MSAKMTQRTTRVDFLRENYTTTLFSFTLHNISNFPPSLLGHDCPKIIIVRSKKIQMAWYKKKLCDFLSKNHLYLFSPFIDILPKNSKLHNCWWNFHPRFLQFFLYNYKYLIQMNNQRRLMFFNSVNSLIVDLETAFGLEHWSGAHFKFHQFFLIIISSITRNTSPLTHFYLDQEKLQLLLKSKVMYPRADTDWFAVWPITYISLDGREICIRRLKISVANSELFW